jgi:hypothetical protein
MANLQKIIRITEVDCLYYSAQLAKSRMLAEVFVSRNAENTPEKKCCQVLVTFN